MPTDETSLEARLARLEAELPRLKEHHTWADGEIARLRAVVRKYEEAVPGLLVPSAENENSTDRSERGTNAGAADVDDEGLGEFVVDYNVDTDVTSLFASRGDRCVTLEVWHVEDDAHHVLSIESAVSYGLYGPSMERLRMGFRGEDAYDTSECKLPDAKVEDLIVALQWLVGSGEMPPDVRIEVPTAAKEGPR